MWDFGRSDRGNAAAEFALCIPLLIIIMVAIIELGRGLHDFHVVSETVRDAARYLSRSPIDCTAAGPATGCTNCGAGGDCGVCDFVDAGGVLDGSRIPDAIAIAMTGDLDSAPGAQNLLGYWTDTNTVTVQICRINNTAGGFSGGGFTGDLTGIYSDNAGVPDTIVPHVRLSADVPFTFMFGELIAPTPTINFGLAHNVIITGR
jgi:hypothetical protein